MNQHLKLTGPSAIDKHDPLVTGLKAWVDEQYAQGRVTAITDNELKEQMQLIAQALAEEGHNEG